ncbi:MAG TPA: Hsp70 family protein, partial [Candidatus Binatia bacterium]|nr:Hsp70 family protein [Candidatus Binatia bacterium]
VVVGRPVRFAGARAPDDDAFAIGRLESALRQAGFARVTFELEPVAAAYGYQQRLDHEELVLIGDFGGGTSDFTLVRLGPGGSAILGVDGVAVAGDAFDARLIRHVAAPGLGLGSERRTAFGQVLPVPTWLYDRVERWEQLSFLKSRETSELLRKLRHEALEPEKIAALVHLVEDDLGFGLHGAVERAKRVLSASDAAEFRFTDGSIDLAAAVSRTEFERWIATESDAITACVDALLSASGLVAADVATVFLTGGSSFVPAVRRIFADRFGAGRLRGGEELTTVATGLALRARALA